MPVPLIPLIIAIAAAGGAGTFGYYLVSTYEGKILSIVKSKMKNAYPDWPADAFGYSENVLLSAIGKLRWYVVNTGVNVDDKKQLHDTAKKIMMDMKIPLNPVQNITRFTAMLQTVVDTIKQTDDDLYLYLRGGLTDRDKQVKRIQSLSEKTDVITPSMIKPKNLLKIGAGIAAAYVLIFYVLPAGKVILKRFQK